MERRLKVEKIKENTAYIVKTKEEDIWFRQWANEKGYKWRSGNSLLDLTYFDCEMSTVGYIGYKISTKHRIIDCSLYLTDCSDIICVKDLMRKESKNMNWKDFCVEASTLEEALEKWKKRLTVSKEEPDYTVKIEGNKTIVTTKDGEVGVARCNPEDKFDVAEGIRVALEHIELQSIILTDELREILKTMLHLGVKTIKLEVIPCDDDDEDVYLCGYDKFDNNVLTLANYHTDFDWMKYNKEYDVHNLLER